MECQTLAKVGRDHAKNNRDWTSNAKARSIIMFRIISSHRLTTTLQRAGYTMPQATRRVKLRAGTAIASEGRVVAGKRPVQMLDMSAQ